MRHPRLVLAARAPTRWERSRNVAWNQRFHKLRSYRGLMGPARTRCATQRRRSREGIGWRIHGGVCHVCVERPGCRGSRTHRKRRDVCATRPRGQGRRETTKIEVRKTNLECALESTVSLFGISLQHRRLGARVGGAHVAMFAVCASGDRRGGGSMRADVDNTGLKRTSSAIILKVKEILAFRANELQGVNSFVM